MLQIRKEWFTCDHCNKKLLIYDNTSNCSGVYIKCKSCGHVNEIKIERGTREPLSRKPLT